MSKRERKRDEAPVEIDALSITHLRVGWTALLIFLSLGLILEALHGIKAGFYLDVSNETRRHLFTLGHAHGTLLSILSLVFAGTLRALPGWRTSSRRLASRCLLGALIAMPLGFGLGGAFATAGDPGLGVLLVPPGGLMLFVAVALSARASFASGNGAPGAKR